MPLPMIRTLTLFATLLLICSATLYAQDEKPKTLYDFRLYEGATEGMDLTEWLLKSEMHSIFYLYESDSVLMLGNVSYNSDSQSFGRVTYIQNRKPTIMD